MTAYHGPTDESPSRSGMPAEMLKQHSTVRARKNSGGKVGRRQKAASAKDADSGVDCRNPLEASLQEAVQFNEPQLRMLRGILRDSLRVSEARPNLQVLKGRHFVHKTIAILSVV